jgi:hypothetical protein
VQRGCAGEGPQVLASAYFAIVVLYEANICFFKLIPLLLFSQRTPLHGSTKKGDLEICRLLLQCIVDVEAKDDE